MFLPFLSVMVLAGSPPALAVTSFRLAGVEAGVGGYAEDRLAQELRRRGFRVSTASDIQAVLGLERQRQLLGCTDSTCIAELSGALGVELVATGRLTRLGTRLELDVRVLRQRDAQVAASCADGVDSEARLGALLADCGRSLADQLLPAPPPRPFRWQLWGPVLAGLASAAAGGVLWALAEVNYAAWTQGRRSDGQVLADAQVSARFQSLSLQRSLGFGFAGLGAALVVTGLVWSAVTPSAPVTMSVGVAPAGASLVVGGHF